MATNKTPVMILQEYAVKLHKNIEFQLIYQDVSNAHNPVFRYAVLFLDCRVVGEGRSKKEAKHNASRLMLEKLKAENKYTAPNVVTPPQPSLQRNAIGILGELCVENNIPDAVYTELSDVGPPHAREFTYLCQIGHFKVTATSTTKKRAKQDAAEKMLQRLNESLINTSGLFDNDTPLPNDVPAILPNQSTDELFTLYKELTMFPKKSKNINRLIKDDSDALGKFCRENNLSVEEINSKYLSQEHTSENLTQLLSFMGISSAIRKFSDMEPCFLVITLDTDPEMCFGDFGPNYDATLEKVAKQTLQGISTLLN